MAPKKEHRAAVRLDEATWKWAAKVAATYDRPVSWVIRSAIAYAQLLDGGQGSIPPWVKPSGGRVTPEVVRAKGGA